MPVKKLPGRELFFAPLQLALKPGDYEAVHTAYGFSKYGHRGQVRDGGTRYFDHPKAAAWIYINEFGRRDPRMIIVLLLHDLSEDSFLLSPFRLAHNFGEDVAGDIRAVTKLKKGKETTDEYLERVIAQGPYAIAGKLFDRLHNVRTMGECTEEKRKRQIEETETHHLPMLVPKLVKHGGVWVDMAFEVECKIRNAIDLHR